MNADNSHAERKILARVVAMYDENRVCEPMLPEWEHRQIAIAALMTHARMGVDQASIALADALATRAASRG